MTNFNSPSYKKFQNYIDLSKYVFQTYENESSSGMGPYIFIFFRFVLIGYGSISKTFM